MRFYLTYFLLFVSSIIFGQTILLGSESGVSQDDEAGYSVAMNFEGNIIAYGSPHENGSGAVRVYQIIDSELIQMGQSLIADSQGDFFGGAIDLNDEGNIIVIGAKFNNGVSGYDNGQVKVFEFIENDWILKAVYYGDQPQDNFGYSVSISGDGYRIAIGERSYPSNNGEYVVYEFDGFNWPSTAVLGAGSGGQSNDLLAYSSSLSYSGDTLAFSAPGYNNNQGVVFVKYYDCWDADCNYYNYASQFGDWGTTSYETIGQNIGDFYGSIVKINSSGTVLAVGSGNSNNGKGEVKIYALNINNSSFEQIGNTIEGENEGDFFGESISLNSEGNIIAIGAHGNDDSGIDAGQVKIFQYTNNSWDQIHQNINGENDGDNASCVAISGNGNFLTIGAKYSDINGNNSGQIKVYSLSTGSDNQSMIAGCTDSQACNFDPDAEVDDGNCFFSPLIVDYCEVLYCGSEAGEQVASQYIGTNINYLTIEITESGIINELFYDVNWHSHGWGNINFNVNNATIALYDNFGAFVQNIAIIGNNLAIPTYQNFTNTLNTDIDVYAGYSIQVFINSPNWGGGAWESYVNEANVNFTVDIGNDTNSNPDTLFTEVIGCDSVEINGITHYESKIISEAQSLNNSSFLFTNNGENIFVESNPLFTFWNGITLSTWVNLNSHQYVNQFIAKWEYNWKDFILGSNNEGIFFWLNNVFFQTDILFELNEWNNIALVYDPTSNSGEVFLNGNTVYTFSLNDINFSNNTDAIPLHIGGNTFGSNLNSVDGFLDEISIWNKPLNSSEINQYLNCSPIGNELGLIALWNFNQSDGINVYDQSPNGFDGLINDAIISSNTPNQYCNSIQNCDNFNFYNITIEVGGCTDPSSFNFDENAQCDDESCISVVLGCTDSEAFNYDENANTDDGSCCFASDSLIAEHNLDNGYLYQWKDLVISDDGSTCAISHYADQNPTVRIYEISEDGYELKGEPIIGEFNSQFGYSIDLSSNGNTIVIGAPNGRSNSVAPSYTTSGPGIAFIYNYVNGNWQLDGEGVNTNSGSYDNFGNDVTISGDGAILCVGDDASYAGQFHRKIHIYKKSNQNWSLFGNVIEDNLGSLENSSIEISANGEILSISNFEQDYVKIYKKYLNSFELIGMVNSEENDRFGFSQSLSDDGTLLAVGCDYANYFKLFNIEYDISYPQITEIVRFEGESSNFASKLQLNGNGEYVAYLNNETVIVSKLVNDEIIELVNINSSHSIYLSDYGNRFDFDFNNRLIIQHGSNDDFEIIEIENSCSILGCTDSEALNFNESANTNDGSCIDVIYGCTDSSAFNFNTDVTVDDDSCIDFIYGCTDSLALNFDPLANTDDGTCCASSPPNYNENQIGQTIYGNDGDNFGISTSISADGNIIAVGARNTNSTTNNGVVKIYENINGLWTQLGGDIIGESAGDLSSETGVELSQDGLTVAIPAFYNDNNGGQSGHVKIYNYDGNTWQQLGQDINGNAVGDHFGSSIALSADGNIIVVGAFGVDIDGNNQGQVKVFNWDGISWTQLGNTIDGESEGDHFGVSVSISDDGNIFAAGGSTNNATFGHVRIFEWDGSNWIQKGQDIDGESEGDYSGYTTSLNNEGSILAVGSPFHNGNTGKVKVFEWNGLDWEQIGQDILPEIEESIFGRSISMNYSGNTISIGSAAMSPESGSSGNAQIYKYNGIAWQKIGLDISGFDEDDDAGIVSLNEAGDKIVVGAPQIFNSINSGYVRVFDISSNTICSGCTDSLAINYSPYSLIDDESCLYTGCTDSVAINFNEAANLDDGSCIYYIWGCTDENACNYDPSANVENGECIYPSSSQESITVCDSYIWNGQTYSESGEYTYTTPNSVGCDSVVYLSLIVNYLSTSFSTVEICNEYQWNGELYTESGEYSYSTINQYGCDSTANLSLTIINCGCTDPIANNYNPEATQDDGNCTYCSFDVNIISQNPSTTNFCDGYFAMTPISGTGPYVYEINGVASTNFFAPACNDIFNIVISDADNCQFEQTLILSDYVGCTDSEALNYDETALFDDESCIDVVEGCMDENADNYLAEANVDDGDCIFYGCMDQSADNFDETANVDDGSCLYCEINIGALVSQENTSFDCNGYIILSISSSHNPVSIEWDNGMTGGFMNNLCSGDYNYTATDAQGCVLSGTVTVTGTVEGCTDPIACNYQSVADIDNGSCVYLDDLNVVMNTTEMGHTILTWEPLENVSIYKVYKGTSLDNMQFIGSSFEPNFTEAVFNNQSYYYQVSSTVECFGITNEVFSNPVYYNYTSAFSVDVVVTDASCLCCNDGAINFTISGGYPPYEINDIGEQNNLAVGEEKIILVSPAFSGALFSETFIIGYDQETYGCMDELAINYDECVTVDDGSCEYENLSACDVTPSGLFVDDIIHNRVVFNWSSPTAAPSHYMIRYRPVGSSSWTVMTAGPVNSNEFTGTKRTRYFMQPGTTYQWNIRARNIDDNSTTVCQSPWSASHQFTTLDECPNLVNHFVNTEANWVDFNASDPESIIDVYDSKGKLREVGTNSFRYVNGNTNGIDVRKGNFTPSTDYEWHTKAWCEGNVDDQGNPDPQYHSGWGEFYQFSTQDPCDKMPTNLYTTTNNNQNLITMNWSTPESGAPHHYFLELVNETTGQVFQWNNIAGNATSKTKYNQVPGHEFSWRIRGACGSIGTSWATIFTQPVYYTLGAERIENEILSSLNVYPNPSRGEFNISFGLESKQNVYLSITNYIGEVIFTEELKDQEGQYNKTIDLGKKANGIYMLNITTNNQNMNQKIVIQ